MIERPTFVKLKARDIVQGWPKGRSTLRGVDVVEYEIWADFLSKPPEWQAQKWKEYIAQKEAATFFDMVSHDYQKAMEHAALKACGWDRSKMEPQRIEGTTRSWVFPIPVVFLELDGAVNQRDGSLLWETS